MATGTKRYFSFVNVRHAGARDTDDVSYLDDKNEKVGNRNAKKLAIASLFLLICCVALYYSVDWSSAADTAARSIVPVDTSKFIAEMSASAMPRREFSGNNWPNCINEIPQPDTRKHIVPPPPGPATLVCCNTTKGTLNIEVHPSWAPLGAERFLHMVNSNFFSTRVGLFRALEGFLVQFGLAGIICS